MNDVPASVLSFYDSRIKVNLLKEYVEFLFSAKFADSKKACNEIVAKLLSVIVDNGDCSIAVIDEIKQYINQYKLNTTAGQASNQMSTLSHDLVEDATEDMTSDTLLSFPEEVATKLKQLREAKKTVQKIEEQMYSLIGTGNVTGIISRFLTTYAKLINSQFITQFKNK